MPILKYAYRDSFIFSFFLQMGLAGSCSLVNCSIRSICFEKASSGQLQGSIAFRISKAPRLFQENLHFRVIVDIEFKFPKIFFRRFTSQFSTHQLQI